MTRTYACEDGEAIRQRLAELKFDQQAARCSCPKTDGFNPDPARTDPRCEIHGTPDA